MNCPTTIIQDPSRIATCEHSWGGRIRMCLRCNLIAGADVVGCEAGYGNCPTSESGCGPCRCVEETQRVYPERDAALAAAEALEARYVAGIRHALRVVHALHSTLPDGDMVPRQSADALALAVEGALLAVLGEVAG